MIDTPIRTALLSVSDKTGLEAFARFLVENGVTVLSTGGTAKFLAERRISVTEISDYTGFPEMMEGRLKTLHPKVHGGLLAKRDNTEHQAAAKTHAIPMIDLLVVNLYPFEATVARGAPEAECIENIDIGGPAMIRSAAKNHASGTVITDPADYTRVMEAMQAHKGTTTLPLRRELAAKAFARTAGYDAAISNWFAPEFPETLNLSYRRKEILSYGENPHQKAALYMGSGKGIATARQLQGKPLSYNNLADADAAWELVNAFEEPACAIIKHANPCGVAVAATIAEAYDKALACDPVSAYGGIVAFNRPLDKDTASRFAKMFVEVMIASVIGADAQAIITAKKNMRLLVAEKPDIAPCQLKTISGGLLAQEHDHAFITVDDLRVVTERTPTKEEAAELVFAFTVCKYVKSNAIVITKNRATIGIGAGQMSRVDSVKIAVEKAHGHGLNCAALASDAFFPFADGVEIAAQAGIKAIIQPGGSIRDAEVIAAANRHGIAMVFTGQRHFRH